MLYNGKNLTSFTKFLSEDAFKDNENNTLLVDLFYKLPEGFQLVIHRDYYKSRGIIITAEFHPSSGKYTCFIVDTENKGTHETYDVMKNTLCNSKYFDDENAAYWHAFKHLNEIFNE